jgi:hypothetical protein
MKQLPVFSKGMLDTLDDVFWMLPFSSKKQAQIIRQENQITDLQWEKRRDLIMAEHRLPNSKEQLEQHRKAWIAQDAFTACRAAATRAKAAAAKIPEYVAVYYFTTCFSALNTFQ